MTSIPIEAQKALFTEARTYSAFLPQDVPDQVLREIYDLTKWGPTSANLCPMRIVFVKKGPEKEKLLGALMPMNVDKVKSAPEL
jgi:3-hydroxypropanoate dehydrogenase